MLRIPYQVLHPKVLERASRMFYGISKSMSHFLPNLNLSIRRSGLNVTVAEYLSYCIFNNFFIFCSLWLLFFLFLPATGKDDLSLWPPLIAIGILTLFIFMQQLAYPSMVVMKKSRDIERNLVPALKVLEIQLSSGVSLFNSLVTISEEDFGAISKEFKNTIHDINTGSKQMQALETMIELSTSELFRRSMWQVVNAMKTGADLQVVLKEVINSLTEVQIVQIQQYGAKLTPLAMFYMMLVVIVPSLSIVFLLLLGSLASISPIGLQIIFWGLLLFVVMVQYMFLAVIKSKRPVLLGD